MVTYIKSPLVLANTKWKRILTFSVPYWPLISEVDGMCVRWIDTPASFNQTSCQRYTQMSPASRTDLMLNLHTCPAIPNLGLRR